MGRNRNFYQNNEDFTNEAETPVVEEAVAESTPVETPVAEEVKSEPIIEEKKPEPAPIIKEESKVEIKKIEAPVKTTKPGIKEEKAKKTATL